MTTLTTATPVADGKRSWPQLIGWGLFFAVLAWSWQGAEMNPLALVRDAGNMATFAADLADIDTPSPCVGVIKYSRRRIKSPQ